jgi:hypothetical protein
MNINFFMWIKSEESKWKKRHFTVNFQNSVVEQKLFSSSKTTRCVIVRRTLLGKSSKTGLFLACKLSLQCALSTITYLGDGDREKDGNEELQKVECHICSGQGPVAGDYEHGNICSDSIKGSSRLD